MHELMEKLEQMENGAALRANQASRVAKDANNECMTIYDIVNVVRQHLDHADEQRIRQENEEEKRDPRHAVVGMKALVGYVPDKVGSYPCGVLRLSNDGSFFWIEEISCAESEASDRAVREHDGLPATVDEAAQRCGERNSDALTALAEADTEAEQEVQPCLSLTLLDGTPWTLPVSRYSHNFVECGSLVTVVVYELPAGVRAGFAGHRKTDVRETSEQINAKLGEARGSLPDADTERRQTPEYMYGDVNFSQLAESTHEQAVELLRRSKADLGSPIGDLEYVLEDALSVLRIAMGPQETAGSFEGGPRSGVSDFPHLDDDGEPGVNECPEPDEDTNALRAGQATVDDIHTAMLEDHDNTEPGVMDGGTP